MLHSCKVIKVRYPRYRATWPRGVQEVKAPQISWHSANEGGKVVIPTHRPPLPPGISWYSFLDAESNPGTWTYRMHRMSPVTRPGIDPGTFRLVAQRLNHYATTGRILAGAPTKSKIKMKLGSRTYRSIFQIYAKYTLQVTWKWTFQFTNIERTLQCINITRNVIRLLR